MKTEVKANWTDAVLVCRKCQKKIGKRFGADRDQSLAKALRSELGGGKGRKAAVGVVETACLGVCPKGAVTVLNANSPSRWHLIPAGTDGATIARMLGLTRLPAAPPST